MSTGTKAGWPAFLDAKAQAASARVAVRLAKCSLRATKSVSQFTCVWGGVGIMFGVRFRSTLVAAEGGKRQAGTRAGASCLGQRCYGRVTAKGDAALVGSTLRQLALGQPSGNGW